MANATVWTLLARARLMPLTTNCWRNSDQSPAEAELELQKDQNVFSEMKDNKGTPEHWKDKFYFSIDAFFTDEPHEELRELYQQIRTKAKQLAINNKEKDPGSMEPTEKLKFTVRLFV